MVHQASKLRYRGAVEGNLSAGVMEPFFTAFYAFLLGWWVEEEEGLAGEEIVRRGGRWGGGWGGGGGV